MPAPLPDLPRTPTRLGAGVLCATCLCALTALVFAVRTGAPGDESAEAGFARDMATHHAQAVEMSFVIRDKSSDDGLRTLAYDIIVTQSTQRGVFMGWLQEWRLPQSSTHPRMAWMPGHEAMPQPPAPGMPLMHGMASEEELRQLHTAQGVRAEVLFLQLMIRHHEGGVLMARALEALSSRADVVQIAKRIDDGQRVEIMQMTEMLAARAAQPYPSLLE